MRDNTASPTIHTDTDRAEPTSRNCDRAAPPLRSRHSTWLAGSLCALAIVMAGLAVVLRLRNESSPAQGTLGVPQILFTLSLILTATIGAFIIIRQPGNRIGWIYCLAGLGGSASILTHEYARYALLGYPGTLPYGSASGWISAWIWVPTAILSEVLAVLVFPDGRLPSPRWRPVLWLAGSGSAAIVVASAFSPGSLLFLPDIPNPLGVESARTLLAVIRAIGFALLTASILAACAALILRLRNARGRERLQLKWVAYCGSIAAVAFAYSLVAAQLFDQEIEVAMIPFLITATLVPLAAGIAIFSYRLYDIDVIINRTLVYGALTASLGLVYVASVILLQIVLEPVTSGSDLTIAVSTLAVAALFRPVRRRIQDIVDNRFYRRKYDAFHALTTFSNTARTEVDLDRLTGALVEVVAETMQPTHVTIWLREP